LNESGLETISGNRRAEFAPPGHAAMFPRCCRVTLFSHHAAIASRAIRTALKRDAAGICVWTSDTDFTTRVFCQDVAPVVELQAGTWGLVTDDLFVSSCEMSVGANCREKLAVCCLDLGPDESSHTS